MSEREQVIGLLKQCLEDWPYAATRVPTIMHRIQDAVAILEKSDRELNNIPSVPAVPLEPLCRYLEVYARTPIYNMRHTAEWWKEELEKEKWEKWTVEQDAAD